MISYMVIAAASLTKVDNRRVWGGAHSAPQRGATHTPIDRGTGWRVECTPVRPALTLCSTLLLAAHTTTTMSSIDLSKLTAAESPEDREAAATAVAKQVTSKVS